MKKQQKTADKGARKKLENNSEENYGPETELSVAPVFNQINLAPKATMFSQEKQQESHLQEQENNSSLGTSRPIENQQNSGHKQENLDEFRNQHDEIEQNKSSSLVLQQEHEENKALKSAIFHFDNKEYRYATKSCFCLTENNAMRRVFVRIMTNKWFDRFITFCIIVNSILLAQKEYRSNYDPDYESSYNEFLETSDLVFTVIFLLEFIIKVVAMGFYSKEIKNDESENKKDLNASNREQELDDDEDDEIEQTKSYIKDYWNWIDFFIVVISLVSLTPWANQDGLKVFRTARVLRPLRSINSLPSMKMLIQIFLNSLPGLINVCVALMFVFIIFAIFGLNFFVGKQYQFCRTTLEIIDDGVNPPYWPINPDAQYLCRDDDMCSGFPNYLGSDVVAKCGDVFRDYGLDPVEVDKVREMELIQYDIVNFNSIIDSLVTVFQVTTMEGWSVMMYNYGDAYSPIISSIFFLTVIVLGALIAVNLVLAQIMHEFIDAKNIREDKELRKKVKQQAEIAKQIVEKEVKKKQNFFKQSSSDSKQDHMPVNQDQKQVLNIKDVQKLDSAQDKQLSVIHDQSEERSKSALRMTPSAPDKQLEESKEVNSELNDIDIDKELELIKRQSVDQTARADPQDLLHNPDEQTMLPSLHGQTMQRFHGILEHNKLEENIDLQSDPSISIVNKNKDEQSPFPQQSSLSQQNSLLNDDQQIQYHQKMSYNNQDSDEIKELAAFMQAALNADETQTIDQNNESNNKGATEIEEKAKRHKIINFFHEVVTSAHFNFFIYCLILGNTITLALYRFDQSEEQKRILTGFDIFFVWAFTIEMIMKLIGLGLKNYVRDKFNIFDGLIVILSLVDFSLSISGVMEGDDNAILSAFRALRLLRVIKLARQWKEFQKILKKTMDSFVEIQNFAFLLFLFMFIQALIGMELFAFSVAYNIEGELILGQEKVKEAFMAGEELIWPRENFNSIFYALVTIFITIAGEDWNQIMYMYVRASGDKRFIAKFYFLMVMTLGNIVLLALFTALLLKNFDPQVEKDDKNDSKQWKDIKKQKSDLIKQLTMRFNTEDEEFDLKRYCNKDACKKLFERIQASYMEVFGGEQARRRNPKASASPVSGKLGGNEVEKNASSSPSSGWQQANKIDMAEKIAQKEADSKARRPISLAHYDFNQQRDYEEKLKQNKKEKIPIVGKSLYLFGKKNIIRKFCSTIVSHKIFEAIIIILICVSTLTLAFENPLQDPNSEKMQHIKMIDLVMTIIFTLEAVLKIISYGFFFNKSHSYLKNWWNILDFMIVIFALTSYTLDSNLSFIKVLRVARILRPLRLIQRMQSLKIAIRTLFKAFPEIMRLQIVVVFVMFMISILLTTLFSGKLSECDLSHTKLSATQQASIVKNKLDCLSYGGVWVTPDMNFDNTLQGIITLFIFQTKEGWIGLMWDSVDAVGIDQQPVIGNNEAYIFIYMFLVVLLCLLFVNMFIGVVIDTFNVQKEKVSLQSELFEKEKTWLKVQIMTYKAHPESQPTQSEVFIRNLCIRITQHKCFDIFIVICILLNTVVLCLKWFDEPDFIVPLTEVLNYIFMIIFTVEAILKIIALKTAYFKDSWNLFDFIIVTVSLSILLLKLFQIDLDVGSVATILRALRIGRVLRLIKRLGTLQTIFMTLIDSAGSLSSLGVLLCILLFMFSIIGRQLFGFTKLGEPNEEVNEHANFQTFWSSFLILMRCATGESWHMIMFDLARQQSPQFLCREDETYEQMMQNGGKPFACGTPIIAYVFFIMFHILVSQIFVNLFIVIIIDAFQDRDSINKLPITFLNIYEFSQVWSKYDPEATGFISIHDFEQFILDLIETEEGSNLVIFKDLIKNYPVLRRRFLAKLTIPTYGQIRKVYFMDTLQQLCAKKNLYNYFSEEDEEVAGKEMQVLAKFNIGEYDKNIFSKIMNAKSDSKEHDQIIMTISQQDQRIGLIGNLQRYANKHHYENAMYADTEDNMHLTDEERRAMDIDELKKLNYQAKWKLYLQSNKLQGWNSGNTQHLDFDTLELEYGDYTLPKIKEIGIYESDQKVQGLKVLYKSGITFERRGASLEDCTYKSFRLNQGEYISSVQAKTDACIEMLTFHTSAGRSFSGGGKEGQNNVREDEFHRDRVIGFNTYWGNHLEKIEVYYVNKHVLQEIALKTTAHYYYAKCIVEAFRMRMARLKKQESLNLASQRSQPQTIDVNRSDDQGLASVRYDDEYSGLMVSNDLKSTRKNKAQESVSASVSSTILQEEIRRYEEPANASKQPEENKEPTEAANSQGKESQEINRPQ